ncbi:Swt1 family HEPN domain-containing protein [Nostoc sp.]
MKTSSNLSDTLKVFGMQNLMLEAELARLRKSGIDIYHTEQVQKDDVVDTELFEADIIVQARIMADFYVLYYSLENTIRRLIAGRLLEKYGSNWWEDKVPDRVKIGVAEKQERERDTPMSIRSDDPLTYTNFGELIGILNANWSDFSDTIRSQKAMQQVLSQFNFLRNVIAHSGELSEDEITRFKLLLKDWFRIQS